jgi:host factor-I protein
MDREPKGLSLESVFLDRLMSARKPISIFLVNGIRLQGQIDEMNESVIYLKDGKNSLMVYKHAIASILSIGSVERT